MAWIYYQIHSRNYDYIELSDDLTNIEPLGLYIFGPGCFRFIEDGYCIKLTDSSPMIIANDAIPLEISAKYLEQEDWFEA